MIVSGPEAGYAPLAQVPRCEPPLIEIFGGRDPPALTCTAAWPSPGAAPMSTLVNLKPGELVAVATMPYCTVSRSMSLPAPYPQSGFCDVSVESVSRIPVKRENTKKSCSSRASARSTTKAVPWFNTQASMGRGYCAPSNTSQKTWLRRLRSVMRSNV